LHNPSLRSVLADEDADFGPTYGNGRGRGVSNSQVSAGSAASGPDFTSTTALTGEDERFAYKRARSRLWEMCGRRYWDERLPRLPRSPRDVDDSDGEMEFDEHPWWRPVGREGRFWERFGDDLNSSRQEVAFENVDAVSSATKAAAAAAAADDKINKSDDNLFPHGASPYRTNPSPPPRIGWQHAWGMTTWGRKAGRWGQGPEAFAEETNGQTEANSTNKQADRKEGEER
jgi:hypothetical protein